MEQKPPKPMTPFDSATTPRQLYMLKLLLPYTPPSMQHIFAVYIRISELQYTLRHFRNLSGKETPDRLFSDLKPYMDKADLEKMEQMEDLMNMMEMVKSMQSMSGAASQDGSGSGENGFDPFDLMKGMMKPEDLEMFSNMFQNPGNTDNGSKNAREGSLDGTPDKAQDLTQEETPDIEKGDDNYE